jgi:hypothetical protein
MKKTVFLLALLASFTGRAADLIVADGGAGGAYSTIGAAVTAAASGDRIIITPKPGGATYNENITITNKSLQFLSATEGTYWKLNGSMTLNPSVAGLSFTISGAHITSGNISSGVNAPAGTRCTVNILGSKLTSGYIDFAVNNFDMTVAADSIMNGYVYLRFGNIFGNYINVGSLWAHAISYGNDPVATNDVLNVVGNKILASTYGVQATYGIYIGSTNHVFNIANNYFDGGGQNQNLIYIASTKSTTTASNYIINNTFEHSNTNSWCIYLTSHNSYVYVLNNVIENNGTGIYGIGANTPTISDVFGYNYVEATNTPFGSIYNDGTNVGSSPMTINTSTGALLTGAGINGGSPDLQYSDIDLSRNDAGCFGGSLTRANYIGMTATSTQVIFFDAPTRILNGQTINISAEGFDR